MRPRWQTRADALMRVVKRQGFRHKPARCEPSFPKVSSARPQRGRIGWRDRRWLAAWLAPLVFKTSVGLYKVPGGFDSHPPPPWSFRVPMNPSALRATTSHENRSSSSSSSSSIWAQGEFGDEDDSQGNRPFASPLTPALSPGGGEGDRRRAAAWFMAPMRAQTTGGGRSMSRAPVFGGK